ncbi:MAG: hypothetical protein KBT39_09190 [Bacteroidales bacterium]|nr:hypothetical protein [Bacteroidales bacterium]
MKSNKFWSFLMMFVMMLGSAVVFTSCGGDDDDDYNGGSGSSSEPPKVSTILATNKVQTVKLHKIGYKWKDSKGEVIFYKDYKYQYTLCLLGNSLTVVPYGLNSKGKMEQVDDGSNGAVTGIVDLGKLNGINEIKNCLSWDEIQGHTYYSYLGINGYSHFTDNSFEGYYEGETLNFLRVWDDRYNRYWHRLSYGKTALPNHGYAIVFNTFEDGVKFIRVYEKSYTQQNDGELTDITVEYQLFDPIVPKE